MLHIKREARVPAVSRIPSIPLAIHARCFLILKLPNKVVQFSVLIPQITAKVLGFGTFAKDALQVIKDQRQFRSISVFRVHASHSEVMFSDDTDPGSSDDITPAIVVQ